jgi:hypothetical protein
MRGGDGEALGAAWFGALETRSEEMKLKGESTNRKEREGEIYK